MGSVQKTISSRVLICTRLIVSVLISKSLVLFDFISEYDDRYKSKVNLLHMCDQFFQHHLLQRHLPASVCFLLVRDQMSQCPWGGFHALYSVPLIHAFAFVSTARFSYLCKLVTLYQSHCPHSSPHNPEKDLTVAEGGV